MGKDEGRKGRGIKGIKGKGKWARKDLREGRCGEGKEGDEER